MSMKMNISRLLLCGIIAAMSLTAFAQPDGMPGMPPGGPHKNTKTVPDGAAYKLADGSTVTLTGKNLTDTATDRNVVQVTNGTLNLNNATITKSGDADDEDGTSFYGINSSVYVNGDNAKINMNGGTILSACMGANGGFAYGNGVLHMSNVKIRNSGHFSRGVHATGGGTIIADSLDVLTEGDHSSVVATDRGGGTVTVNGGKYVTTGTDCAILYSTGSITANNATGCSVKGEVGVIEGDNHITINNCDFTSKATTRGLMILQSGSGDSQGYNGRIVINGGRITLTDSKAPLCEIPTNITGTLTLKDVQLTVPSKVLMSVDYNKRWSTNGGTGNLILSTDSTWTVEGTVVKDSYAKSLNVTVGKGVTWTLSADTDIDELVNNGAIILKGHKLTYKKLTGNKPQA